MSDTRIETDTMGSIEVPAGALYGAHTARAMENFPISGWRMPGIFLAAMGLIKQAAAKVNQEMGLLPADKAEAILSAAQEVIEGKLDGHFPVDVFQTGSGTSTNMNINEVIANRAAQLLGGQVGDKSLVHPNDHVNMSQSSNDVIPTAMHVATAVAIHHELVPELRKLQDALEEKARQMDGVVKIGRTHLMDAVPVRMGQVFGGYAAEVRQVLGALGHAVGRLCELAIGGTAVGTGLNAPEGFARQVCLRLADGTSLPFQPAENHFEAQAGRGAALAASSALRSTAVALGRIASDIRLMASGPRGGLGELKLPPVQPGSSIMPGKVNPVICESVIQVSCQVVGCDAAIAAGAAGGVGSILELNVATPMIAANLLNATNLLAGAARAFRSKCLEGLEADAEQCAAAIEHSTALVTALAPRIGYDAAAAIAGEAFRTGKTVRELCRAKNVLPAEELAELLDPRKMTGP